MRIKNDSWDKLLQFIKFGLVGLANTLISYIIYVILVFFSFHYLLANIVGFLISIINAYYWNNKYVFQVNEKEKQVWWKSFLKTFISYAGTGLILNNILLFLWVDMLGIHEIAAPIINLFISVPINFILNKYWAFKKAIRK